MGMSLRLFLCGMLPLVAFIWKPLKASLFFLRTQLWVKSCRLHSKVPIECSRADESLLMGPRAGVYPMRFSQGLKTLFWRVDERRK